jgi:hypothetical protein
MIPTPTISVRRLDSNHDPVYGGGKQNFLTDADAVAQLIQTSLLLLQGEWWADLTQGFPLFQKVLGTSGNSSQVAALLIQQTIIAVPYVTGMAHVTLNYNSLTRTFSYFAIVYTQFGEVQVNFAPGNAAAIPVTTTTPLAIAARRQTLTKMTIR